MIEQILTSFCVFLGIISIPSIILGAVFGLSYNCVCPEFVGNLTVTTSSMKPITCLVLNETKIVKIEPNNCNRYPNYEVALAFFGIGLVIFVFFLTIFIVENYNLYSQKYPKPSKEFQKTQKEPSKELDIV